MGYYLDKWGELIIKTKDNLYDYLYNYIKAYLCFYRQNISIINFKQLVKMNLIQPKMNIKSRITKIAKIWLIVKVNATVLHLV